MPSKRPMQCHPVSAIVALIRHEGYTHLAAALVEDQTLRTQTSSPQSALGTPWFAQSPATSPTMIGSLVGTPEPVASPPCGVDPELVDTGARRRARVIVAVSISADPL